MDKIIALESKAKAYRELEREGIVSSQRGVGLFVTNEAVKICARAREKILKKTLNQTISEAVASGFDIKRIKSMIEDEINEINKKGG